MKGDAKARSAAIQAAARALLEEHQVPLNQNAPFRVFVPLLRERTGCGIDTAKRHIARAQRLARGEYTARQWGGARNGAGRPKD